MLFAQNICEFIGFWINFLILEYTQFVEILVSDKFCLESFLRINLVIFVVVVVDILCILVNNINYC